MIVIDFKTIVALVLAVLMVGVLLFTWAYDKWIAFRLRRNRRKLKD